MRRIASYYSCTACLAALLLALNFAVCLPLQAQPSQPSLEYRVKASLIYNFLQYVEWPPDAMEGFPTTINICIVGPDPFGPAMTVFEREVVQGRRLNVRHVSERELLASFPVSECQVVFVGANLGPKTGPLLSTLSNMSTLTIGETYEFLRQGGIISLQVDGGKVIFDISRPAALQARLKLSSKLLRIAHRVIDN